MISVRFIITAGSTAHLVNDSMSVEGWEDAGAVLTGNDAVFGSIQPECPDYFKNLKIDPDI